MSFSTRDMARTHPNMSGQALQMSGHCCLTGRARALRSMFVGDLGYLVVCLEVLIGKAELRELDGQRRRRRGRIGVSTLQLVRSTP